MTILQRIGFLLALAAPIFGNSADWSLVSNQVGSSKPALVEKVVANHAGNRKVNLTLSSFSSRGFTLKVIDQGNSLDAPKFKSLKEAMEKNDCVAGVNGGFFDKQFKPFGVVYQDGKRIASYSSSSRSGLASGVIWSGVGGIHIAYRQEFKGGEGVRQAIQTGPMLVKAGSQVKGLSTERPRPRTFMLTDWKGNWMLGTSSFVSLADLAAILASPGIFPEFRNQRVDRAINLDGGRSTGFYQRNAGSKAIYRPEFATVRNFLGIVPK